MIAKVSSEKVGKILKYYGEKAQAYKTIEELNELAVAIAHKDKENIEEEIGDVLIMIAQLILREDINTDKIEESMDYKIDRQLKRINAVG